MMIKMLQLDLNTTESDLNRLMEMTYEKMADDLLQDENAIIRTKNPKNEGK